MKKYHDRCKHRFTQKNTKYVYLVALCLMVSVLPFSTASTSEKNIETPYSYAASLQKDGWEIIESGATQDLNSIFFICLNRGSVVGDEGVILRTGDGGDNWTAQDSGVTDTLNGVFYYGYSIILAVGTSGTILYTNNTGQNWTVKQTGMMATYFSGQMISDMVGVAVGVNAIFQPFFTRTNDGWNSWESNSFYIEHNSVLYEGWLSDVYFMNASVGFATAVVDIPAGGAIVRTTDGGSTWETMCFYDEELFSIDFTWEGIGYAVGDNGAVLQTLDGGETWQELESGVNTTLHAVDFSSETKGTIVGDSGVILRTENAGLSWVQQTSGTTYDLLGVQFITDMFGVVVGDHGMILRTHTGGYPKDTEPPETTCILSGTLEGDVYISNVTVTFTATDNTSGVAATMYKLDDAPWTTYDVIPFVVVANGYHLLRFYSIDNAGNIEEEKTSEFTIQYPSDLAISMAGGTGIRITIKNLGSLDLINASWNLSLDGGLVLFGKQKSGVTTIAAGDEVTLNSLVFGFGKPTMTFTIASSEKISQGRVFLFFVRF
jgi:photosystem II stability/assembly factor-like uncharacterized protein